MIAIDFGRAGDTLHPLTTFIWSSSEGTPPEPPPIVVIANSSIDEWFTIDYRQQPRPLTPRQWMFLRQMFAVWKRSRARYLHELGVNARLEARFASQLTSKQFLTPRERYAARIAARRKEKPRRSTRDTRGVREPVRKQPDRAAHPAGPGREVWRT